MRTVVFALLAAVVCGCGSEQRQLNETEAWDVVCADTCTDDTENCLVTLRQGIEDLCIDLCREDGRHLEDASACVSDWLRRCSTCIDAGGITEDACVDCGWNECYVEC